MGWAEGDVMGVGLDDRKVGIGRAGRTRSKAGLPAGVVDAFLLDSGPIARSIFSFSVSQILREWPEYFLTEGRVTRCPAL